MDVFPEARTDRGYGTAEKKKHVWINTILLYKVAEKRKPLTYAVSSKYRIWKKKIEDKKS